MADENTRRESDQTLYIWKEKLKTIREFISNVGVPAILVIGFAVVSAGTYLGYIPQPSDNEHQKIQHDLQLAVEAMTKSHEAQTNVLQQTVAVLKEMRCDLKPTDQQRVKCFRKAVNGHQE